MRPPLPAILGHLCSIHPLARPAGLGCTVAIAHHRATLHDLPSLLTTGPRGDSLDWFKGKSTGNHGFSHQIDRAFRLKISHHPIL